MTGAKPSQIAVHWMFVVFAVATATAFMWMTASHPGRVEIGLNVSRDARWVLGREEARGR